MHLKYLSDLLEKHNAFCSVTHNFCLFTKSSKLKIVKYEHKLVDFNLNQLNLEFAPVKCELSKQDNREKNYIVLHDQSPVLLGHPILPHALGPSPQSSNRSFRMSRAASHNASPLRVLWESGSLVKKKVKQTLVWKHFRSAESDLERTTIKCKMLYGCGCFSCHFNQGHFLQSVRLLQT